jgi:hypothetical protein
LNETGIVPAEIGDKSNTFERNEGVGHGFPPGSGVSRASIRFSISTDFKMSRVAFFVSVWTGLRVSELIGLKWRCIHPDSITVEERFCRGDWSTPKTSASAATIGVAPQVIARINGLKSITVEVRAGCAIRKTQTS